MRNAIDIAQNHIMRTDALQYVSHPMNGTDMRSNYRMLGCLLVAMLTASNPSLAEDPGAPGSVTFAFDGGTLRCTFGTADANAKSHIALLLYPSSIDAFANRSGIKIKRNGDAAVVLVSDDNEKFVQLTSESVIAWSKMRITDMSKRRTSIAENSVVSVVVHALTNNLPISLWGARAEDALEAGTWCQLFHQNLMENDIASPGNPFDGDPFMVTEDDGRCF